MLQLVGCRNMGKSPRHSFADECEGPAIFEWLDRASS